MIKEATIKEIKLVGRGGQGVVLGAEMLAAVFVAEGKYAISLPMFGFERRGAPVSASVRFDDKAIRERTMLYNADCIVVLEPFSKDSPNLFTGLKPEGILILNASEGTETAPCQNAKTVGVIDATRISLEEIGKSITNTTILGAIVATTEWLSLDAALLSLEQYFTGDALKKNIKCVERGFREVIVKKYSH